MDKNALQQAIEQRAAVLTQPNADFYGRIMVYTRLRSKLKDPIQVEQNLLDLLNDLIDAQTNGTSAADYFGADPLTIVREILAATPNSPKQIVRSALGSGLVGLIILVLPTLLFPNEPVDLGQIAIGMVLVSGFYLMFTWGLSSIAFAKHQWLQVAAVVLVCSAAIGLIEFGYPDLQTPLRVHFTGTWSLAVLGAVLVIATIVFNKVRRKPHFLGYALAFYLVGLVLIAACILVRLPQTAAYFSDDELLIWLMLACLAVIMIVPLTLMIIGLIKGLRARHAK
ncbi:hypothetical protein [Lacticaseibacillus jixiensis]|uniref:hypothetical protein n=1 Tax=Lacticaseibacillus jixiensis TaxID=3231926 RepID=UPI0036F2B73D